METEFKAKLENEKCEEKQKIYYNSKDYQKLERKKTKVGIVKKKTVNLKFFDQQMVLNLQKYCNEKIIEIKLIFHTC